jgi:DNA-binding transcriptional regulator YhcF (GntR family)
LVSPSEAERELVNGLGHWPAGPEPLYQRLAEALRAAIERDLPVGATLPPERRLAELLHVSRTTVVAAYRILRQEGLLRSRQGSGTQVAEPARAERLERRLALGNAAAFRGLIDRRGGVIDFSAASIGAEGILTEELQARAAAELSSLTRPWAITPTAWRRCGRRSPGISPATGCPPTTGRSWSPTALSRRSISWRSCSSTAGAAWWSRTRPMSARWTPSLPSAPACSGSPSRSSRAHPSRCAGSCAASAPGLCT